MPGYRIVKATRCEEAQRRMIDHMVRRVKETIKSKPYHNTILLNLVTLRRDCDTKMIEERLKEEMPGMEFTVDVGVSFSNVTELIIRCKQKEHFPTLMWKGRKINNPEEK